MLKVYILKFTKLPTSKDNPDKYYIGSSDSDENRVQ